MSKLSFKCQNCNSEIIFDNLINHYEKFAIYFLLKIKSKHEKTQKTSSNLNFGKPVEYISYNSNYNKVNRNQHKHRDDGYYKCVGCRKPMCELGYNNHKDDGYYKCIGCRKPMCDFGYNHKNDGYYKCVGCRKPMCEL